jgi:chemotaxis signal transduction protein
MYGRHALREAQLPAPWPPPRGVLRWPLDLPGGGVALRVDALEPPRTLRFDALPRELTARTGVRAVAALDHGDGALALLLDAQAFGHGAALAGDPSSGAVAPPDATRAGATAWLAFDVGMQCCGIDLRALCEIALPRPPVYPLPGADARLPGVSFWRGAALPLLDVGAVLDSRPSLARDGAQLMICEAEGERWGWIVDRVRGMRDLGRGDAITVGPGLPPPWDAARELLGGHGDDVCALLQPAALLRHALAPRGTEERR